MFTGLMLFVNRRITKTKHNDHDVNVTFLALRINKTRGRNTYMQERERVYSCRGLGIMFICWSKAISSFNSITSLFIDSLIFIASCNKKSLIISAAYQSCLHQCLPSLSLTLITSICFSSLLFLSLKDSVMTICLYNSSTLFVDSHVTFVNTCMYTQILLGDALCVALYGCSH